MKTPKLSGFTHSRTFFSINFTMFIEINQKKLKKIGAGVLTGALAIGLAAGYRVICPGEAKTMPDSAAASALEQAEETGAAASADWGLSFQTEGQPPVANAGKEELAKYNAFYCGNSEKVLYLTFDAGFENGCTEEILDVLKEEKVPAAFFLVGTYIKENRELVKRMEKEGHIVGNHTMHHPDMSAITEEKAFEKELREVEEIYKDVTGKKMKKFYRPPQGKFSRDNLTQAKDLGYTTVFWSLAYVDWYTDRQPTREEALKKLVPRTHDGAVILLHSTSKTNAAVLQELIGKWKDRGYKFKALADLSVAKK